MFEVAVEQTFAAAHALRDYKGKCEPMHGHNFRVRVTVQGAELDQTGLLIDFLDLKRVMNGVIERLDHLYINEVPPFDRLNPSAENIAKYFYDEIHGGLGTENPTKILEVKVWETDIQSAAYRP